MNNHRSRRRYLDWLSWMGLMALTTDIMLLRMRQQSAEHQIIYKYQSHDDDE